MNGPLHIRSLYVKSPSKRLSELHNLPSSEELLSRDSVLRDICRRVPSEVPGAKSIILSGSRALGTYIDDPLLKSDYDMAVLQAAAAASVETGAPVTTHTEEGLGGDVQQKILMDAGVPAHRIIIGHTCGNDDHDYHMNLLNNGTYVGFDRFGITPEFPDEKRVASLLRLLKKNRENRIVVGQDSVWCSAGGAIPEEVWATLDRDVVFNPLHFHDHIIPQLLAGGATQEQIDTMLIDNPRRFFLGDPG